MRFFAGCYTDAEHEEGLIAFEVDAEAKKLRFAASHKLDNPLYLAVDAERGLLAANHGGGLALCSYEWPRVEVLDTIDFAGRAMCHVSAEPGFGQLYWAAYLSGECGAASCDGERFGEAEVNHHSGSGVNLPRQDAAHPHCAVPAPGGAGYAVCDLGLDRVYLYPEGRYWETEPKGAGPRHILFHPNGKLAFVVFELENLLGTYEWLGEGGLGRRLDLQRTVEAWPTGRGANGDLAAAVRFTPDGKGVVVSNRGEQSLVEFRFGEETGKLEFAGRSVLQGSWPRDFIFVGDGLALVAMERSGEILLCEYDAETHRFRAVDSMGGLHRPVALVRAG